MTRFFRSALAALVTLVFPVAAHAQSAVPIATSSPTAAASTSPKSSASPVAQATLSPAAIDKLAHEEYEAWKLGVVDRTRYSAQVTDALTEAILTNVHTGLTAEGAVRTFTQTRKVVQDGFVGYTYRIVAEHGRFDMDIAVDNDGLISGLRFTPAP
jgi:hypothetical protein